MIYLDEAATAKYQNKDNIVVETITTAMKDSWMNPSSLYAANTKERINKCRYNIAKFIGARADEIYFTSGASESNSWAIKGWDSVLRASFYKNFNIISTPIEHKSILAMLNNNYLDATIHFCDVDEYGVVNCESLETLLSQCSVNYEPILVSVSMANNEIGTIQPIKKIADLVHKHDGMLHVDATQAFGHIPINVEELGVDMMSASGHKLSPVLRGIGFLYKKNNVNIHPLICGTQENSMRGGTENTYGILGLNKAVEHCDIGYGAMAELCEKRDYFVGLLVSEFGCKLNGHSRFRLPNNINVVLPEGVTGESVLIMLSMSNIFVSTSSACNSHSIEQSHVLKAIGLTDEEAMRSIRISIPEDATYKNIDYFVNELDKAIKIIKG